MALVERLGDGGARQPRDATTAGAPTAAGACERSPADARRTQSPTSSAPADGRGIVTSDPRYHVIACVDVQPASVDDTHAERPDLLWRFAVRRMERCIRADDKVCMLGGPRIAVCLGDGGNGVVPSALARRLARAMGSHFVVGAKALDLKVSIGVGATAGDVEPAELAAAAMASIRGGSRRALTPRRAALPPFVAVTHLPTGIPGPARAPRRLMRRVLVPFTVDADELGIDAPSVAGTTPTRMLASDARVARAAGLRVLLVDPDPGPDNTPRPMVDAVAALSRRAGAEPIVASVLDPDAMLLNLYLTEPDVVVLVLQAGARHDGAEGGSSWERPAQLARVLRETGTPVVALSMGASAAALAVSVEQGAVGLFHSDLLPQELARLATVRANGAGAGTANGREETRGPGQLPAPYNALVHLTPSERRVLFHMMEGRSAAEIADTLVVSLTTVRSHIRSILRKLNVNSQLAAVALAFGTIPRQVATA
jgi:DNA-binding NarL/FixJ family response regulator